ncbi:MAG TPA: trypsin-like peptidase domain-containing protein [Thermoanaerobaculia bacterium]|jgi:S1-C subfamily serine protease|nr:trypsin-like peptidase domain-containing protein [Thermoanaerobaculia bacterium]
MTNLATELSNSLAAAVAAAAPSIVRIGRGTGIAWSPGVIISASHALPSDDGISIDGAPATLAGRDPSTDLAVLRVDSPLTPLTFVDGDLQVGHLVLAAGRPGRSVRATLGMLSAIGGEWRTDDGARIERYLEVDGTLPPGFSGGPLLDTEGRALGLNTSRLTRAGGTIPTATLRRIVTAILEHGSTRRPFLGVGVYPVDGGLLIMSVHAESAAKNAGLMVGDVLTSYQRPHELYAALREGGEVLLQFTRGGSPREVRVTI